MGKPVDDEPHPIDPFKETMRAEIERITGNALEEGFSEDEAIWLAVNEMSSMLKEMAARLDRLEQTVEAMKH